MRRGGLKREKPEKQQKKEEFQFIAIPGVDTLYTVLQEGSEAPWRRHLWGFLGSMAALRRSVGLSQFNPCPKGRSEVCLAMFGDHSQRQLQNFS